MNEPRRKPPVDFGELPTPHGARVGARHPIDGSGIEARARLAEIMIPAQRVKRWAKDSPEFASLPSDHPIRELVRTVDRLSCRQSIADLVNAAEGATLSAVAVDRVLEGATPPERARAAISIVATRARS